MSRKESIIVGYALTGILAIVSIIAVITYTPSNNTVSQDAEKEELVIDGHSVEVVYDDYGAPYLKYIIQGKNIYIPLPLEAELPDNTDSLKFYYTKNR